MGVYKRALDREYQLKMKTSRALFSEINRKYPALPFTLRAIEDQRSAKLGMTELLSRELLHEYPVLYEKQGELVAHFKSTVLLMKNGSDQLSAFPVQNLDTAGKKVEDARITKKMTSPSRSPRGREERRRRPRERPSLPAWNRLGAGPRGVERSVKIKAMT